MDHSSIRFVEAYRKSEVNIVDQRANLYRCPTWPLIFPFAGPIFSSGSD